MLLMESASCQSHLRAVYDGFDAESADTSGTSRRRYRPCRSTPSQLSGLSPQLSLRGAKTTLPQPTRKNWLFIAGEDGGTWAPDLLTVFQSCRLQRLDAVAYLSATMPALIAGDVDPLTLTPAVYAESRRVSA
jgi:hypothetical protein